MGFTNNFQKNIYGLGGATVAIGMLLTMLGVLTGFLSVDSVAFIEDLFGMPEGFGILAMIGLMLVLSILGGFLLILVTSIEKIKKLF